MVTETSLSLVLLIWGAFLEKPNKIPFIGLLLALFVLIFRVISVGFVSSVEQLGLSMYSTIQVRMSSSACTQLTNAQQASLTEAQCGPTWLKILCLSYMWWCGLYYANLVLSLIPPSGDDSHQSAKVAELILAQRKSICHQMTQLALQAVCPPITLMLYRLTLIRQYNWIYPLYMKKTLMTIAIQGRIWHILHQHS